MSFAKRSIKVFIGATLVSVGLLWFLQGTHLMEAAPLVCAGTCTPITERSLTWTIIGSATIALGCGFLSYAVTQPPKRQP